VLSVRGSLATTLRYSHLEDFPSPVAHRGGRVIDTDTLPISLVSHVSSDGQEHEQDSEDNPNVNAHQSKPAAVSPSRERLVTGRPYLCLHFARSTIRRISVLESTLSMSLK
jgi:hypothetical protein